VGKEDEQGVPKKDDKRGKGLKVRRRGNQG
jgi:hypothetical protein